MVDTPDEETGRVERKPVLLRLDPAVHAALARWASDDLRSLNAHIELLLRQALRSAGRSPREAGPLPKRGRPARRPDPAGQETDSPDPGESTGADHQGRP